MIDSVLWIGLIIWMIWMLTFFFVDKKKKNILCIIGGIACIVLLLYTRQWKIFLIGMIMGGLGGGGGISGRGFRHMYNEFGLIQSILVGCISIAFLMMIMVAATPGIAWWG